MSSRCLLRIKHQRDYRSTRAPQHRSLGPGDTHVESRPRPALAPPIYIGEHSALDSDTCASLSTGIDRTAVCLRASRQGRGCLAATTHLLTDKPVRSRTARWRPIETTEWSSEATSKQTRPPSDTTAAGVCGRYYGTFDSHSSANWTPRVASSRLGFPDQISRSTPANWRLEPSHRHSTKKCPDEGFCRGGTSRLCGRKCSD